MAWVKLDDQFPDHPKVDGLSDGAFRLHVSGLCHAGRYLTDGHIPKDRPSRLMANYRPKFLKELIDSGLWLQTPDGYMIHAFTEFNKTKAWWEEKRAKDAQRLADWRARNAVGNAVTSEVSNEGGNARPVPVPVPGGSLVAFPSQSSSAPLDDDGLTRIKEAIGNACTKQHAKKTADFILAKAPTDVRNPVNYILKAIREEPELYAYRRGNPRRDQECTTHAGEWADNCRACALDARLGDLA